MKQNMLEMNNRPDFTALIQIGIITVAISNKYKIIMSHQFIEKI